MELKSNLPSAAEETAENLLAKKYDVVDKNQLEADFLETLADTLDSDSDIRLKVNAADKEKQLLSVSVTEEFKHPNGKLGTVSYDRTAVVNKLQEEVLETYQISYYLTNTDTECYKCYTVHADDMVPVPKNIYRMGRCRGKCSGSEYDDDTGCSLLCSLELRKKMKKIRKNRMLNILIIGMGTFIFVEVFLFTAVAIFIVHCLGI